MNIIPHFIDGVEQLSVGGQVVSLFDPTTGAHIANVSAASVDDANKAVASARRAFTGWSFLDPSDRGKLIWALADAVAEATEEIAALDSRDVGKPFLDCVEDVNAAAKLLRFYAGLPDKIRGTTMPVQPGYVAFTEREPFGVVAAIVPWNYPIYNACSKIGAIIAMGNTCVLKPAEQSPSSAVLLGKLALKAGIPAGVLNILSGDAVAGEALARHNDIDKVSFTGSTATGRNIMRSAADSNLKSCTLELGGKSPNIIFDDADLDAAAEAAAFSIFYNQGQTCTAATRVIVSEAVARDFTAKLVERARNIKVGDPTNESTQLGPLVSKEQFEKVLRYINLGKLSGAKLEAGGERIGEVGYYIQPTVFSSVPATAEIATEEIFGPVASIVTFTTEEQAIALANGVPYGLAASIWTNDVSRMHRLARAISAGLVWGNCLFAEHPSVPVGGYKQSGFGKEYGLEAGYEYTRQKSVWINLTGEVLHWTGVEF
jgi:aldehyde dehydrogenase (NAD+)